MRGRDQSTEIVLKREDALRTVWKKCGVVQDASVKYGNLAMAIHGYPGYPPPTNKLPMTFIIMFNHLGPCVWAPLPLLGLKFGHSQVCGVSMNWPLSFVMAKHSRWNCFPWLWRGSCWSLPAPVSLWLGFNSFWPLKQRQTWINLDSEARILDDFNYILGSSDLFAAVIQFAYILLVQPLILYLLLGVMADVQNLEKQFKEFSIQKSQCFCCTSDHRHPDTGETLMCDRKFVYEAVRTWYAAGADGDNGDSIHFEKFDQVVRTRLRSSVLEGAETVILPFKIMFCLAVVNQAPAVVQMMTWSEADMLRYGVPPVSETSFARSVWRIIAWVCFVWVKQLVFILVAWILLKTILLNFSNWFQMFQMFHKTFRWGDVVGGILWDFPDFLGGTPRWMPAFYFESASGAPTCCRCPDWKWHCWCHHCWCWYLLFTSPPLPHHMEISSFLFTSCSNGFQLWQLDGGCLYHACTEWVPSADTLAVSMRFWTCFTKLRSGQADLMVPGWKQQALGSLGKGGFRTLM